MKLPHSSTRSVARSKKIGRKSAARSWRRQAGSHAQRPFVVATFAMTADGKLTTKNRGSVDFTSREDKLHLIRQRALGDAVLVGHTTLERDNVRLGIPDPALRAQRIARGQPAYPIRVIISNKGRINPSLNIFQADFGPIVIFSTTRMPRRVREQLRGKAILHLSESPQVDLRRMLRQLRSEYAVKHLACEGGPALFRSLLQLHLVDQLNLTIAPFLFGGEKAPTLTGVNSDFLPRTVRCSLIDMNVVGEECFLAYQIKR